MINSDYSVSEIKGVSDDIHERILKLLSQLTSAKFIFSINYFHHLIDSDNTILFGAFENSVGNKLLGILTLAIIEIPTGKLARIEDVVVDKESRGKGIGEQLTLSAIEKAKSLGIKKIDLTSNPSREAANRLYQRMGFTQRNTNVYRLEI